MLKGSNMISLQTFSRISAIAIIIFTISSLYGAEIVIAPDSADNCIDSSVYFVTREPSVGYLRVTLNEYWGFYGIQVDLIRYDEHEGLPAVIASYHVSNEMLTSALGLDDVYGLEFREWIDPNTLEIGFNSEQTFLLHVEDNGVFTLSCE